MNLRLVAKVLGKIQLIMALAMCIALAWSLGSHDGDHWALLGAISITALIGLALLALGHRAPREFYHREALAIVGLGWTLCALTGALPYVFSGLLGPVDAFFESMSGLTTTGATVITDIDITLDSTRPAIELYHGIIMWRALTHWIGGLGIIALLVTLLPTVGIGAKLLYQSESAGVAPDGVKPRLRQSISRLIVIYVGLTAAEGVLLWHSGMSIYDAICHSFATISTGGFSTRNASVGGYQSLRIEIIVIVFMILSAVNFLLHYQAIHGRWLCYFRDPEWKLFAGILLTGIALVTIDLSVHRPAESLGTHLRWSTFSVTTVVTCTGFTTADYGVWPPLSKTLLVFFMFVGGSAGSTSGGLKVVRALILLKIIGMQIRKAFSPRQVMTLRVGPQVLDEETQRSALIYFVMFLGFYAVSVLAMAALGVDIVTSASSVIASMSNVGPGLGMVGPSHTYALLPSAGKIILSLAMLVGRLEMWAILCLFLPSFWRPR
ncbi:TrkH family potassium uptake protein [Candidatus Sumerlaeota bacterium]|nr:TrkH family potassium uptake protein [Candidatus Sumerlaeota bacterium]